MEDITTPINLGQSNLIYPMPGHRLPTFSNSEFQNGEILDKGVLFKIETENNLHDSIELKVTISQVVCAKDDIKNNVIVFSFTKNFRMKKVADVEEQEVDSLLEYCADLLNKEIEIRKFSSRYLKAPVSLSSFSQSVPN